MLNRSILLYLYSTANIIGSLWGLIGLVAYALTKTTALHNLFLYLVPVLYLCGYLISPKNQTSSETWISGQTLSPRDLQIQLEGLIKKISKRLTKTELDKLTQIKENILMLLPRLEEMNAGDYDLHVVKQTVMDYLPKMLTTYLELPPTFARMHKMRNGKTAQEVLMEQLTLLEDEIAQIVISANRKDAEALIAQGEFLKSKFANDQDWL